MKSEDWAQLRVMADNAGYVPEAVCRMLTATSAEEARAAYWTIDNSVVVQRGLFEAAPATTLFLLRDMRWKVYRRRPYVWAGSFS